MTQTYVTKVEVVNRTQVKKVTIGTPIRKVTGAAAQTLGDLTDIDISAIVDNQLLQYDAAAGKWNNTSTVVGVDVFAGAEEPGGDF